MEIEVATSGINVPHGEFSIPKLPFDQTVEQEELEKYAYLKGKEHIVIIGQGGSVNSIRALAEALPTDAKIHIVDSQDPYKLNKIKQEVAHSCLIIPISKSGNTLSVFENTLYFNDLPMLFITERAGALYELAVRMGAPVALHPPVGGRFIGNTLPCLLPAYLAGMDTENIIKGGKAMYKQAYRTTNNAALVARCMHDAEQNGYVDVFAPIYDARLTGSALLIMQLCHETYGKNGTGQSIIAMGAPESQHHTDQRYFGGPKNMLGCFVSVKRYNNPSKIFVPEQYMDIAIKGKPLGMLNNVHHVKALHAELTGVLTHAKKQDMPYIHILLHTIDPYHIGFYMAFWQCVAVYNAVLRGSDPFDQPEVEYAKNVTRDLLL